MESKVEQLTGQHQTFGNDQGKPIYTCARIYIYMYVNFYLIFTYIYHRWIIHWLVNYDHLCRSIDLSGCRKNTGQIQQVGGSKIDFCKSIFLGTSSYAENSISFFSKPVLNHHWWVWQEGRHCRAACKRRRSNSSEWERGPFPWIPSIPGLCSGMLVALVMC